MYYLPKNEVQHLDIDKYLDFNSDLSRIDINSLPSELAKHTTVYSYYHGLLIWQKEKLMCLVTVPYLCIH